MQSDQKGRSVRPSSPKVTDSLAESDVFHFEFYLTSIRNDGEFLAANIKPEEQDYLRFNRPDLPINFSRVDTFC